MYKMLQIFSPYFKQVFLFKLFKYESVYPDERFAQLKILDTFQLKLIKNWLNGIS